jgi:adenylate kinase
MIILLISGSPGTGKTSVSKEIAKKVNARIITLNLLAQLEGLVSRYDEKRETWVINEEKLKKKTLGLIETAKTENIEVLIIEGHFVDIIPEKYADLIIILRCEPSILSQRLRKRGYKEQKVKENIQSEILGNCVNYFIENKAQKPLYEIDTSKLSINQLRDEIIKIIYDKEYSKIYKLGQIDWLEMLFNSNQLMKYFD